VLPLNVARPFDFAQGGPFQGRDPSGPGGTTVAEAIAVSFSSFLAFAVSFAYLADRLGLPLLPFSILAASGLAALAAAFALYPYSGFSHPRTFIDLAALTGIVALMTAWLVGLSWPDLLLPGSGSDLAHHLQLVDYLDRHGRLPHDPAVEAYLGEMSHYTPGVHLLASLTGRWFRTDGFHAIYPIVALSVALKAGLLFLVAVRVLRSAAARARPAPHARLAADSVPFAVAAVAMLFLPYTFFAGSFARFSYVAQIVSELFAVMMWWALTVWDERPSLVAAAIFAVSAPAAFLTWPIWIGPPLVVLVVVVLSRPDSPIEEKRWTLTIAVAPLAAVALLHAGGRLGWTGIVATTADTPLPAPRDFGWPFLALAAAGTLVVAATRSARTTALLIGASVAQTLALYAAATIGGASVPYMAIKMAYWVIYPLSVAGALALASVWRAAAGTGRPRAFQWIPWAIALVFVAAAAGQVRRFPVRTPVVSESLYEAGRWARDHLDPSCVDYVVGDDNTAYWLHLAVLGNRRMSARTADDRTFVTREMILRWINQGGLPYAVADLGTIPKDVLGENDELARFGSAVVIRRRGRSSCPQNVGRPF
jgi:hypothetical protein